MCSIVALTKEIKEGTHRARGTPPLAAFGSRFGARNSLLPPEPNLIHTLDLFSYAYNGLLSWLEVSDRVHRDFRNGLPAHVDVDGGSAMGVSRSALAVSIEGHPTSYLAAMTPRHYQNTCLSGKSIV